MYAYACVFQIHHALPKVDCRFYASICSSRKSCGTQEDIMIVCSWILCTKFQRPAAVPSSARLCFLDDNVLLPRPYIDFRRECFWLSAEGDETFRSPNSTVDIIPGYHWSSIFVCEVRIYRMLTIGLVICSFLYVGKQEMTLNNDRGWKKRPITSK